ncbi:MAG: hypothetical protein ACK4NC_02495 [Candidatus Gracilibacteria bacterium]
MSDLNTLNNTPSSTPAKSQKQAPDALKGTIGKIGESIDNIASTAEVIEYNQEKPSSPAQSGGQTKSGQKAKQDDGQTPIVTQKVIPQTAQAIRKELTIEIKRKINILIKEARELEKKPGASFAYSLQRALKDIRKLNLQLSTMLHLTFEKLREVYMSFFPNAVERKDESAE